MANIGKLWAGYLYGTNTGKLAVELESEGQNLTGIIRIMDTDFGPVVYSVRGTFDGGNLEVSGTATHVPPDVQTGEITAKGTLTPKGELTGQWSSTLGTGGTFFLFPHNLPIKQDASIPEQLHTVSHNLGALRLYAEDVWELAETLKRDFSVGRLTVTYKSNGVDTVRYYDAFEAEASKLGELRYLKFWIQEHEAHGINKLAMIEFNALGSNDIMVQGIQDSWVVGKAETILRKARKYEKGLTTNFKRFGFGMNQIIFFGALAAIPEVSWPWRRIGFVAAIGIVLVALTWLHQRYVPGAIIYLTDRKPGWLERSWPSILSWIMGIVASVLASLVFYLLTNSNP